jgi:chromosome partitioning protein
MKLIAVISHKGGAGKTTSSVQIAEELARRGHRTLLVDADRQQGAGLLLGIDAPAGCVQRTTTPQLDYLGSARLTDLEIADCFASVANRFDIGVVDTPSLDDALARAWLREATAILMVLQVDPLTVKTLPNALNTLEMVRAFKPSIQILGLLPTMFDPSEEAHGRLLAELLSRRPEAVFTPVVPADPGLMHRANAEECPPLGEAACQAYQCAVDRILRALEVSGSSVSLPRVDTSVPTGYTAARPTAPPTPAWAVESGGPAAAPAGATPRQWQETRGPSAQAEVTPRMAAQPPPPVSAPAGGYPLPADEPAPAATYVSDRALDELAGSPPLGGGRSEQPRPDKTTPNSIPDWWPQQDARVDSTGVARKPESWLMRSRFAIACTVACLALLLALVTSTMHRAPAGAEDRQAALLWEQRVRAALAAAHADSHPVHRPDSEAAAAHTGENHKKVPAGKHARRARHVDRHDEPTGK